MTRYFCALMAILCAWITCGHLRAQELIDGPENEEVAVEVDLLDEGEADAAFWSPEFLSAGAFTGWASQGHVYSNIDFAALSASDEAFDFKEDLVVTPRVSLGWESESGFGMRGIYWNYKQSFTYLRNTSIAPTPLAPGQINQPVFVDFGDVLFFDPVLLTDVYPQEFKAQSIDLEVYQRILVGQTRLLLGTGLRNIERFQQYEIERTLSAWGTTYGYYELGHEKIEGMGGTLLIEFEHPLIQADSLGLAFVVGGRTSYIPAEYEVRTNGSTITLPINKTFDDEFWINDGHVGLEFVNRHRYVTTRLRGQFETQYWNSAVTDNQAFTGVSTSLGVEW